MKATQLATFLVLVLLGSAAETEARVPRKHGPQFPPSCKDGEILAIYDSSVSVKEARLHQLSIGHHPSKTFFKAITGQNVHVITTEAGAEEDAIYDFEASGVPAQCNHQYQIETTVPNDPSFSLDWGLHNTGQTITGTYYDTIDSTNNPGTSGDDMGLESAWDRITDCSSVIVAVVDTGINYNHADLAANMWNGGSSYPNHGYDFVASTNNPMDLNGHGTHVAGTIGAVGNNGIGGTGVCWKTQLMAVRVLDSTGSGSTSTIASGISFATAHGAKVINMSLGGSSDPDSLMENSIAAASNQAVVVVAAGNDGTSNDTTPVYPCNSASQTSNIVCVAALDQKYNLASFSNYGATSVHVGAPGVNILSTWAGSETTTTDPFTFGSGNWTNVVKGSGSGWGYQNLTLSGTAYNTMTNPTNWNGSSAQYSNNANDSAWKNFTSLASASTLTLDFFAAYDTEATNDVFSVYYAASNGDPTPTGTTGTQLDSMSGTTSGTAYEMTYDISSCAGQSNCSIGFHFSSNGSTTNTGVILLDFSIIGLNTSGTTYYNLLEGTSMATPHVSGLAAMLFAYNPSYTVSDVIKSIENGGVANPNLAGKTTTGNSVSAIGSLNYISPPQSPSAADVN